MRILCCVKRVPAPGAKINVTADGNDVDAAHLGFTTSPHEECAVEGAVQLAEEHGGDVTVMTLGTGEAEEQLRYAVSVGCTHAVLVEADTNTWDPQRTAAALTAAIRETEASSDDGAPFDLILFGNESADSGASRSVFGSRMRSVVRSFRASRGSRSATTPSPPAVRSMVASRCTSCRVLRCWG